jgi:hypothetical protein
MNFNSVFKDFLLPLLPSLLTILGWFLVFRRENRVKDNEIHNRRISLASNLVGEIVSNAKKYYVQSGSDSEAPFMEQSIKSDLKKLSGLINLINMGCKKHSNNITIFFIDFRRAISGGEFEISSRLPYTASHPKFNQIHIAENELFIELEKLNQTYQ